MKRRGAESLSGASAEEINLSVVINISPSSHHRCCQVVLMKHRQLLDFQKLHSYAGSNL